MMRRTVTMQLCRLLLCVLLLSGKTGAKPREPNLQHYQNIHYTGVKDNPREPSHQNIHYTGMEDDPWEPSHQNIHYTSSQTELRPRALQDIYPKGLTPQSSHKQLLGALQEVLEKLQAKKMPAWEKKLGQVPTCDVGEQCAVRKGSRIGRMCDCPRGALCNFYLLKCL